jgi:hypothetical protein
VRRRSNLRPHFTGSCELEHRQGGGACAEAGQGGVPVARRHRRPWLLQVSASTWATQLATLKTPDEMSATVQRRGSIFLMATAHECSSTWLVPPGRRANMNLASVRGKMVGSVSFGGGGERHVSWDRWWAAMGVARLTSHRPRRPREEGVRPTKHWGEAHFSRVPTAPHGGSFYSGNERFYR